MTHSRIVLALVVLSALSGLSTGEESKGKRQKAAATDLVLFDGKSLKGWELLKKFDFSDHGKVELHQKRVNTSTVRTILSAWAGLPVQYESSRKGYGTSSTSKTGDFTIGRDEQGLRHQV